jgi:malate dehydrogenase
VAFIIVILIPTVHPLSSDANTLLQTNAGIVRDLAQSIAKTAPKAHILVISNPVNSTVSIVSSVLQKAGTFDPARLFGVTTLDVVRASRFLSSMVGTNPKDTPITVVGGHSGVTIVHLLSQTKEAKGLVGDREK